jgi:predicted RNase H-like HicB family nuclease
LPDLDLETLLGWGYNIRNSKLGYKLKGFPITDAIPMEGNMKVKPFFIRAEWDEEASVWVATSDDVPGLVTEEATMEGLIEKLKIIIPELLEANGVRIDQEVPFEVLTRRFETVQTAGV